MDVELSAEIGVSAFADLVIVVVAFPNFPRGKITQRKSLLTVNKCGLTRFSLTPTNDSTNPWREMEY